MTEKQHSEQGGPHCLGESLTKKNLSTCDQHGDHSGPLGLLDVPSTQRIPNADTGGHAEACRYLKGRGSRGHMCREAARPLALP